MTAPSSTHRTRLRLALLILAAVGAGVALVFGYVAASDQFVHDAHAYWAADPSTAYTIPEASPDALLYAPPVVQLFSLFKVLPWPAFAYAWSLMEVGLIALMAGPFTLFLIMTPPIASEITLGNIHALLGIAVILGFRWPGVWAGILLTKVTPGIGLLWFVFRREWRNLGIALGVTAAIAVPTMVLAPDLWARWIEALTSTNGSRITEDVVTTVPLVIRLALAVPLLWWGARRNATWVVPVAVLLGLPVMWNHGLAIALASIWLAMHPRWPQSAGGGPAPVPAQAGVVTQ